jgi:hypothetical protein
LRAQPMRVRSVQGEDYMSKFAKTVDQRVLKDDELKAVAGGFQAASKLLQARVDALKVAIASAR